MIRYTNDITAEEYMALRDIVGWMQFPLEEARICVEKAYLVLCARDDDKAIGVVRLLWDGGYIAFLSDVIVIPEYQGQGIGRALVQIQGKTQRRCGTGNGSVVHGRALKRNTGTQHHKYTLHYTDIYITRGPFIAYAKREGVCQRNITAFIFGVFYAYSFALV